MMTYPQLTSYQLIVILLIFYCNSIYATEVSTSGTLPVLYITTENNIPVTSKTEYINASYWLDPMDAEGIESLGSEGAPLPMQIRGRGHSSWKGPKKPYKIKLAKKTAMMGMPKNKHWALLKPTENTVAGLQLGKLMEMAWSPSFRPVEVVLNGDYIGLYFLTETIRIDENRVNIYEQQDQEINPELIKGGWLVEVDNYRDECQITIPENNRWNLTLSYHSPEDLSDAQLQWLTDEFKAINAAIYSTDKTSTEWEKYIDVESMARYFILQEVMDNPDGFHGSFYLHKDLADNARWIAGPIWDLVCYNREKTDYTFRMKVHYGFTPHWIGEIIQYDSFCKAVGSVWRDVYPEKLSEIYDYIDETVLPLEKAWKNDCERWNEDPTQTAVLRAERIKNALRRNIEWFNSHLPISEYAFLPSIQGCDANTPVKVFNLQGIFVGEYASEREAISNLQKGLYIIGGRKIIVRKIR
ncbi:CotH kinase family protein [Bacteroides acidifaciens]|uniref:CotH kinase family protein n=1 Tax=Bacteroides acidifaciens TaxID=85831 RepID=UPI0025B62C1A|nr:CotH kinase family protein [Bacteroides acidifaciens]